MSRRGAIVHIPFRICGLAFCVAFAVATGCASKKTAVTKAADAVSLSEARRGFETQLTRREGSGDPIAIPPAGTFRVAEYKSLAGNLAAYVSSPSFAVRKYPAIIWLFGGFDNGIGDTAWAPATPDNDQSARAFWQNGIVTMYPSLRGGNQNPGSKEGFYGEVDDVIAAADWLASQTYVDPQRIYLGGHSTGGTLALLAAESTNRFRAVFSFGPVADVSVYGQENLPFDIRNSQEVKLRSPIHWLQSIKTPTFVFEGARGGNVEDVLAMKAAAPNVRCHIVDGHDHFSLLAQVTPAIALAILADQGPQFDPSKLRIEPPPP